MARALAGRLRAHEQSRARHAKTGANVIMTDFPDWATNCPEYKVTAAQVQRTSRPSDWQARFFDEHVSLTRIAAPLDAAE